MPAAKRISKEAIIDAAAAVLRIGGFEAINARSVAKALGCSTQPIYLSFRNMEELKSALTQRAIEQQTRQVRESLRAHEGCDSRYSSYGMGFVQFAAQEKHLFRWLYLEDNQPGRHQADVLEPEIIRTVMDEFGYDEVTARADAGSVHWRRITVRRRRCRNLQRGRIQRINYSAKGPSCKIVRKAQEM